jgi:hypothetical protein
MEAETSAIYCLSEKADENERSCLPIFSTTKPASFSSQVFLGCEFPADEGYRAALQEGGMKVGKALAAHGAMERFAMDFVTVKREDGGWDCHAIEINLRW